MRQSFLECTLDGGILLCEYLYRYVVHVDDPYRVDTLAEGFERIYKDKASQTRRQVDRARKHKQSLQYAPTRGRAMPLQALRVIAMNPKFDTVA